MNKIRVSNLILLMKSDASLSSLSLLSAATSSKNLRTPGFFLFRAEAPYFSFSESSRFRLPLSLAPGKPFPATCLPFNAMRYEGLRATRPHQKHEIESNTLSQREQIRKKRLFVCFWGRVTGGCGTLHWLTSIA